MEDHMLNGNCGGSGGAEGFTAEPRRALREAGRTPGISSARLRRRGFTFVEMMVVITITVLLITMAIPIFNNQIRRANESVLKNNLFTLRTVIDNYTGDKLKAPQSLQDLVSAGYLREIPYDPMTKSNQTWRTVMEDASQSVSQSEPGIFDVKSGSDKMGGNGTPYAEW